MRKINKRTQSSMDNYVEELFDTYSKLNVIRIELSYNKKISKDITTKEVRQDLKRLLNNRRHNETIFGECVGHICKLEKGEEKGNHLHSLFFFNGHKIKNDVYKASQIGKYWKDNITNGKGLDHNCNAEKAGYTFYGVGMINHFDTDKRNILTNLVTSYFAKDEQKANDGSSQRERTFFKGIVTKQKSNAGRPRKEPNI